jgi:hypothetical protein
MSETAFSTVGSGPEVQEETFLVDWGTYSADPIFVDLTAINHFLLRVQFPQFRTWTDASSMSRLGDTIYNETYELLERARLFRFEDLVRTTADWGVGVHYKDSDNEFHVELSTTSQLTLRRPGSSMKRFYDWYVRLVPEFHRLYEEVKRQLERDAPVVDGAYRTVVPAQAGYMFKYVIHNFRVIERGQEPHEVKNSALMKSLLRRVPDDEGKLVDLDDARLGDLGRVDVSVNRWIEGPGGTIREIYQAEAPGNLDYGSLWLNFHYIAETRSDNDGNRDQPDFSLFLKRYDYPILEFLQRRALTGFLSAVTRDVSFQAAAGPLP